MMELVYCGTDEGGQYMAAVEVVKMAHGHPRFWPHFRAWINAEDTAAQVEVMAGLPVWVLKDKGAILGAIWVDNNDAHTVSIGMVKRKHLPPAAVLLALAMFRDRWVSDVFRLGTVDRILAVFDKANSPVRTMCEICGFHNDGILRHHVEINGEWRDYELWTLLREDWEKREAKDACHNNG